MKLYQYRFSKSALKKPTILCQSISGVFDTNFDINIITTYWSGQFSITNINCTDDIEKNILNGLSSSFKMVANEGRVLAIKSLQSCRKLIFEYDGLMRIVQSNNDNVPRFGDYTPEVEDISSWLIDTDVFDLI
jgi:hypothetical protein